MGRMQPRRATQRDANEPEIVAALRDIPGVTVELLDKPADLLVGYERRNYLFEVKAPGGRLTDDQVNLLNRWRGQYNIVMTIDDCLRIMEIER